MEENAKSRRRWFRFSLRTMLVLVTLVCVYLGWAMNWIRQRREFLDRDNVHGVEYVFSSGECQPPTAIWLLGECGYFAVGVKKSAMKEEARKLFPESKLYVLEDGGWSP